MDYSKETFPLNHFALYCKGWYRSTKENESLENVLRVVFEMDGYPFAKTIGDFLGISVSVFDDYNDWLRNNGRTYATVNTLFYRAAYYDMRWRSSYISPKIEECLLFSIMSFLRERDNKDLLLDKPVYSRALMKKGLCYNCVFRSNYHGMTYAEQNRIANKIFGNESNK